MNAHRGYVPIEIDGEEYALRLDFNALATADSRLNTSLLQALGQGRFDAIQTAIQVGLANPHNGREATKAARSLDGGRIDYYLDRIMAALEASGVIKQGDDKEADEGESQAP